MLCMVLQAPSSWTEVMTQLFVVEVQGKEDQVSLQEKKLDILIIVITVIYWHEIHSNKNNLGLYFCACSHGAELRSN